MEKTVEIEVKNIYGVPTVYPVNDYAKIFASLTGKKTFSHNNLCQIEALGFQVKQVMPAMPA